MELELPNAFAYTIFCDDVRQEVGNKLSFMGIYHNVMFVAEQFPVAISKLCLSVAYWERAYAYNGETSVLVFLPGDADDKPTLDQKFPFSEIRQSALREIPKIDKAIFDKPTINTVFQIQFSPLELKESGFIKVRIRVGDTILRAGSIRVQNPPEITAKASMSDAHN